MRSLGKRAVPSLLIFALWVLSLTEDLPGAVISGVVLALLLPVVLRWAGNRFSVARRSPSSTVASLRRSSGTSPGRWIVGTLATDPDGTLVWRAAVDMEPKEIRIPPSAFWLEGDWSEERVGPAGSRLSVLRLRQTDALFELGVSEDAVERIASMFERQLP